MLKQSLTELTSFEPLYALARKCKEHDGYPVKLYWNVLHDRRLEPNTLDYLFYKGSRLLAVLNVYFFTDSVEITAMVDPEYRGMGIFKKLLNTALLQLKLYDVDHYQLICHENAKSFTENLLNKGATLNHSEIEMIAPATMDYVAKHELSFQLGTHDTLDLLLKLHHQCFPNPPEEVMRRRFTVTLDEPHRRVYLAQNSAGDYVGKLHVREEHAVVYLHDIGIIPKFQRQGYGQSLMANWHKQYNQNYAKPIIVEVLSDNIAALNLYSSVGYKITNKFNFWQFPLVR